MSNVIDLSSLSKRATEAVAEQQQLIADLIGSMVAADDDRARRQLGEVLATILAIPDMQRLRAGLSPHG